MTGDKRSFALNKTWKVSGKNRLMFFFSMASSVGGWANPCKLGDTSFVVSHILVATISELIHQKFFVPIPVQWFNQAVNGLHIIQAVHRIMASFAAMIHGEQCRIINIQVVPSLLAYHITSIWWLFWVSPRITCGQTTINNHLQPYMVHRTQPLDLQQRQRGINSGSGFGHWLWFCPFRPRHDNQHPGCRGKFSPLGVDSESWWFTIKCCLSGESIYQQIGDIIIYHFKLVIYHQMLRVV